MEVFIITNDSTALSAYEAHKIYFIWTSYVLKEK